MSEAKKLPSQGALLFPFLQVLADAGGAATSATVRARLADAAGLDEEQRTRRVRAGAAGPQVNEWGRHVRWVHQLARAARLAHAPESGVWELTDRGERALHNALPGVVVQVFVTEQGVMLWGEAEAALAVVEDDSIDLFLGSLPYPDQRKAYEGQRSGREQVDWALTLAERVRPKLRDSGSMVLNLAAPFERGAPAESTWIHRLVLRMVDELGLVLCQTLYWHNPAKLPAPAEWVCLRRERLVPDVEPVLWFAKHPHPYADNTAVLRPYSRAMRRRLAAGGEAGAARPSGHVLAPGAFSADNGGAIAGALLSAANTDSNSHYFRRCRETGLPPHPARFPPELPERVIGFLTPPAGLVADLFSGSGETAAAAERLGRRWIACDLSLTYVRGSSFHFERSPGFRSFLPGPLRPAPPAQADLFAA
ncbi:MAG TPA: DNA methyltransferase [Longimicrobium sp.]|jgi:site-specific DNA-methyltransferase (cytosine-N4-specific)